MNSLFRFMASPAGRIGRVVIGGAVVVWGILGIGSTNGIIVAVLGTLPVLTGILNICILAPLFGAPLSGSKVV